MSFRWNEIFTCSGGTLSLRVNTQFSSNSHTDLTERHIRLYREPKNAQPARFTQTTERRDAVLGWFIYIRSAQRPRECTKYRTEPHADSLHDLAATSTPQLSCSCKSRTWGKLQVARRARRVSSAHTDHRSKTALTGHHPCCKAHTARRRAPRAAASCIACTQCSTWRTRSRCTNWAPATGCARRSRRGGAQPYETHR